MSFAWADLPRPIRALAPMEDVTDTVFRRIIARCGRPDVFFTEFIHTDIVLARRPDRPGLTPRLRFTPEERPLIAQIWGADPEEYRLAALRLRELKFDGIDINMGCPVRKILKKGAGAALILKPVLAAELIQAAKCAGLPVSVKTRIGFSQVQTEEWIGHLLDQDIDALTVHGRTAEQESEGSADWEQVRIAVALRDARGHRTVILGNGDVRSADQLTDYARRYGVDGVMVGRGAFEDPYLFSTDGRAGRFPTAPASDRVGLLVDHLRLYRETWGDERNYEILKKFYKIYLSRFHGADELRDQLNATGDYAAAEVVIAAWRAGRPRIGR
ncbi:MAG: tRNA-dihydrouridine synthase [Spirochaetia bacterium]